MADILDSAIKICLGLEKKAKEIIEELQKASVPEGGDLTAKQSLENKVVLEGVKAVKELLKAVNSAKDKLEEELSGASGKVFERLNVAREEDIDVVKEMARVAREKVDNLEKRVAGLEARLQK
ncbi:MAG: accessory factor UbiK family protein [Deltaproteobacteria bacterium]|nr:accessory factor UbiK family protein [Deltaproteobacteria bacterium]